MFQWSNLSCSDPTKTDCLDHRSRCLRQAQKTLKLSCNRLKLACSLTSSFLFTAIPCKHLHIYDLLDHSTLRWIPNVGVLFLSSRMRSFRPCLLFELTEHQTNQYLFRIWFASRKSSSGGTKHTGMCQTWITIYR